MNLAVLLEAKRSLGYAISVCLPARNEASTIGGIVTKVRERLGEALWAKGRFAEARQVFEEVALSEAFPAFLTLVAQRDID